MERVFNYSRTENPDSSINQSLLAIPEEPVLDIDVDENDLADDHPLGKRTRLSASGSESSVSSAVSVDAAGSSSSKNNRASIVNRSSNNGALPSREAFSRYKNEFNADTVSSEYVVSLNSLVDSNNMRRTIMFFAHAHSFVSVKLGQICREAVRNSAAAATDDLI